MKPGPKKCKTPPRGTPKKIMKALHKMKMFQKKKERMEWYADNGRYIPPSLWPPANLNRRTGDPHEHRREIARRVRQSST